MHIGVFGGSFNPVHRQHLQIALSVLNQTDVDEIWLVPVFNPVHKPGEELADYESRCMLLNEAVFEQQEIRIKISDTERELAGPSYTINTIKYFQGKYPMHSFSLIIGGDSLQDLPFWYKIDELAKLCDFIVAARPGYTGDSSVDKVSLRWVNVAPSPISASAIRNRLARGENCLEDLYSGELFVILQKNLYGSLGSNYGRGINLIKARLKDLPAGLVIHIEGVARLAFQLACRYGADLRDALIAGMAHDLFRASQNEEVLKFAAYCSRPLREVQKQIPMLAHGAAAVGFLLANGIELPEEVFDALFDHTFPEKNSPFFTRLLSIADTLEPSRNIPDFEAILMSDRSFDELFFQVLQIKAQRIKI